MFLYISIQTRHVLAASADMQHPPLEDTQLSRRLSAKMTTQLLTHTHTDSVSVFLPSFCWVQVRASRTRVSVSSSSLSPFCSLSLFLSPGLRAEVALSLSLSLCLPVYIYCMRVHAYIRLLVHICVRMCRTCTHLITAKQCKSCGRDYFRSPQTS